MNIAKAVGLVADDVRKSYPELSVSEALEHAISTVSLESVDGNDETAEAYRFVLTVAARVERATLDNTVDLDLDELP